MDFYVAEQLIYGIVHLSSPRKQQVGRKLAKFMAFIPGPVGTDGGVDGAITNQNNELVAHFQSKLSSKTLSLSEGKILHSDLVRLKPQICVYVAGVGYDSGFIKLIEQHKDCDVYLLTLQDIFLETDIYKRAIGVLPKQGQQLIDWSKFLV